MSSLPKILPQRKNSTRKISSKSSLPRILPPIYQSTRKNYSDKVLLQNEPLRIEEPSEIYEDDFHSPELEPPKPSESPSIFISKNKINDSELAIKSMPLFEGLKTTLEELESLRDKELNDNMIFDGPFREESQQKIMNLENELQNLKNQFSQPYSKRLVDRALVETEIQLNIIEWELFNKNTFDEYSDSPITQLYKIEKKMELDKRGFKKGGKKTRKSRKIKK